MTEKYTDLAEQVIGGSDRSNTVSFRIGVAYAFEWLDEHPDQVPGRTMTAGEMEHKCATYGSAYESGFKQAGGQVVPDPEPTNAEKIATEIDTYMQDHGWGDNPTAVDLAGWLSDRGVKAPVGDDD